MSPAVANTTGPDPSHAHSDQTLRLNGRSTHGASPAAASEKAQMDRQFREEALPHLDSVYRFALRLTGDESRAEDLVQESFLRAYRSWHQYTLGTSCRNWLFTICRNLFVRGEEKRSRHRQILQENAPAGGEQLPRSSRLMGAEPSPDPEESFFHPRIDEALLQKINELPPKYREVVILSDIEDLTYREIAEVIDAPVGTVRSRLSRGRKILRAELREYARERGLLGGRSQVRTDVASA